jgi:hypothetical protein
MCLNEIKNSLQIVSFFDANREPKIEQKEKEKEGDLMIGSNTYLI